CAGRPRPPDARLAPPLPADDAAVLRTRVAVLGVPGIPRAAAPGRPRGVDRPRGRAAARRARPDPGDAGAGLPRPGDETRRPGPPPQPRQRPRSRRRSAL